MPSPIPDYLSLLADIKCLFSLKMNNQQEDDYQCLLVWAKQMPLLQLQLASDSFSEEIQQELLNLLRPVQKALSASIQITEGNLAKGAALAALSDYVTYFYEYFSLLPKGRAESAIIKDWQDANGHGSIPPLQPMPKPKPILATPKFSSAYASIFSSEEKWQKGEGADHEYKYLTNTNNSEDLPESGDEHSWR